MILGGQVYTTYVVEQGNTSLSLEVLFDKANTLIKRLLKLFRR